MKLTKVLDPSIFRNKDTYIFCIYLGPKNDENNFGAISENSFFAAPQLGRANPNPQVKA